MPYLDHGLMGNVLLKSIWNSFTDSNYGMIPVIIALIFSIAINHDWIIIDDVYLHIVVNIIILFDQ